MLPGTGQGGGDPGEHCGGRAAEPACCREVHGSLGVSRSGQESGNILKSPPAGLGMRDKACGVHRALGLTGPRERCGCRPTGRALLRQGKPPEGVLLPVAAQALLCLVVSAFGRGQELIDGSEDCCPCWSVRHRAGVRDPGQGCCPPPQASDGFGYLPGPVGVARCRQALRDPGKCLSPDLLVGDAAQCERLLGLAASRKDRRDVGHGSPARAGDKWGTEPPERSGSLHRGDVSEPVPSARGSWDLFYPAFAAAVRGERPLPVNPWDAVATAAVLDAARTSARTGQVMFLVP
jgi:hypothetical protein